MIPLAVLSLALLGFIVWSQRRSDAERRLLLDRFELERKGLLNRIQAPEAAPFIEAETQNGGGVDPNDDQGFWDAEEQMRSAVERMQKELTE